MRTVRARREVTQRVMLEGFWHTPQPLFDPLGFSAHDARPRTRGGGQARHAFAARAAPARDLRGVPRAAALGLVGARRRQPRLSLRDGALIARTRDHSHVELLLREGLITVEQVQMHPMRNFVESCLGGDAILPEMAITERQVVEPGDVFLVCTDGLWGALRRQRDRRAASRPRSADCARHSSRWASCRSARGGAASDNTSAAALRWLGD